MAYDYFDLGKAMNTGLDIQAKRAQLDAIMQGQRRQRQIQEIAGMSTTTEQTPFTDYSRMEGETSIPGLAAEKKRFDPEKMQKNLMDKGFSSESASLHESLAKMGKADREKLDSEVKEIAQAVMIVKNAPEDKKEESWNFVANSEAGRKYNFPKKYDKTQTPMLIDQTINDARQIEPMMKAQIGTKAKKFVNITKDDGTKTTGLEDVENGTMMEWNGTEYAPITGGFVINSSPSYRDPQIPNPGISTKEQESRAAKYIKTNWPKDKPKLAKEDSGNFNLAVVSRARKIQSETRGDYEDALAQAFEEESGKTETKVNKMLGIDALSADESTYKPREKGEPPANTEILTNKPGEKINSEKIHMPKTVEDLRKLKSGDKFIWKGQSHRLK